MKREKWTIRRVRPEEIEAAMDLALRTFEVFEAPVYGSEGSAAFRKFVMDPKTLWAYRIGASWMWGCFAGDTLIGMVGMRRQKHIELVFVEERYHKKGIGRALMEAAFTECREKGIKRITLNSAPYAYGFYYSLGFQNTGLEQTIDGIQFTPMEYMLAPEIEEKPLRRMA